MKQGGILVYKRNLLLVTLLILAVAFTGCIGPFKAKPEKITLAAEGLSEGNKVSIAEGDAEVKLSAKVQTKKDKEVKVDESEIKWEIDNKDLAELSAETGAKVTLTAKAAGTVKVTVKYEELTDNIEITIVEEVIEEEEDEEEEPVDQSVILFETFDADDLDHFFSADYKALPNDSSKPMYYPTSGKSKMTYEKGALTIIDARFTIGMPDDHHATGVQDEDKNWTVSEEPPKGQLDLSKPYKITLEYSAIGGENLTKKFQVYVDNNQASDKPSVHGSASRIYNSAIDQLPEIVDGVGTIVIESDVGTANSFIQIRMESKGSVTLKSIKIEYQE